MIFVFLDDGTLDVVTSLNEARKEYEGVDVEAGAYQFYDSDGAYMVAVFVKPSRRTSFLFGLLHIFQSGEFILVPSPELCKIGFRERLSRVSLLNENPYFASLDELKSAFGVT